MTVTAEDTSVLMFNKLINCNQCTTPKVDDFEEEQSMQNNKTDINTGSLNVMYRDVIEESKSTQ